jgi:hypothetical protein
MSAVLSLRAMREAWIAQKSISFKSDLQAISPVSKSPSFYRTLSLIFDMLTH